MTNEQIDRGIKKIQESGIPYECKLSWASSLKVLLEVLEAMKEPEEKKEYKPDYHTMNEGIHKDPIREVYEKWTAIEKQYGCIPASLLRDYAIEALNAIKQHCEDK